MNNGLRLAWLSYSVLIYPLLHLLIYSWKSLVEASPSPHCCAKDFPTVSFSCTNDVSASHAAPAKTQLIDNCAQNVEMHTRLSVSFILVFQYDTSEMSVAERFTLIYAAATEFPTRLQIDPLLIGCEEGSVEKNAPVVGLSCGTKNLAYIPRLPPTIAAKRRDS